MFGLNRGQPPRPRPAESTEERYVTAIAAWQVAHGTDRHDLTPEQDARRRTCDLLLNVGLDLDRMLYWRAVARRERGGLS
jgi:hypothetical protein